VEFEVHLDSIDGDPLVLQPQSEDDALRLFGEVHERVVSFQSQFDQESVGFFLTAQDQTLHLESVSQPPSQWHQFGSVVSSMFGSSASSSKAEEMKMAQQMQKEVWDYNQSCNILNVMTGPKGTMTIEAGTFAIEGSSNHQSLQGILAPGNQFDSLSEDDRHKVSERFNAALKHIADIERSVGHDPIRRKVYAFQDDLLPQIGIWSTDRRRKLRDQVHVASLKIHGFKQAAQRRTFMLYIASVVSALLLVGLVLYGIFGPHNSWLVVGIALAVILVCACCGFGILHYRGAWKIPTFTTTTARATQRTSVDQSHPFPNSDGRGLYAKVMADH
jgi:hypothetical protein